MKRASAVNGRPSLLNDCVSSSRHWLGSVDFDRGEPAEAVGLEAVGNTEKLVGNLLRDFAHLAVAYHNPVDSADGGNFGRSAGEEDFVGNVEQFARESLLSDSQAEMASYGEDAVSGDAGKSGVGQRRGIDDAIADHKNIFPGAFADQSVDVERDALLVAIDVGFHADELGIHVIGAGLGQGGHGVGSETVPTRHADIGTAVSCNVFAPWEVGDVDLNGRTFGV